MAAERATGGDLAMIDASGRVQLPADTLAWFPQRRARVHIADGRIEITPP